MKQDKKVRNPGFVYLVNIKSTSLYKIGHTKHLQVRLSELSKVTYRKLQLVHAVTVNDRVDVEKKLHSYFSNNRVLLEWFEFNPSDIKKVIRVMDGKSESISKEFESRQGKLTVGQDFLSRTNFVDWVEANEVSKFTFIDDSGYSFLCRLNPRNETKNLFWGAYKKIKGKTKSKYLGRTQDITVDKLLEISKHYKKIESESFLR